MVLDFEYGINTGNRFLDLVDHDEDPDEFIAGQTQPEPKAKKSTKDTKSVPSTSNKKTTTTTTTTNTTNVSSNTTKTNKENLTGKSTNPDQRRQQSNVLSDNNNQQTRIDSGRGGRGFSRRGGQDRPPYEGGNRGGGHDRPPYEGGGRGGQNRPPYEGGGRGGQNRPPYEGGSRGGGQQRTQRYNNFEGQQPSNETGGDTWGNEGTNDNNQSFGEYRGRGRGGRGRGNFEGGRGNYEGNRGNYEGGRGNYEGGRGRGRGRGRGNYNNRNFEEGPQQQQQQQQQQTQDDSSWQASTESNFDNTRSQSARTAGQEVDTDVSPQERPFESDNPRRGGRDQYRSRTFHNNRNYGGDRQNQYERGTGEVSNDEYRHNRRQHDRQPRTNVSSVKPIEKKEGEGAHNWGNQTENPEEHPVSDEITETTGQTAPASKDWSQQVDEAEKQMTLDEYKKQIEAKKQAQHEKLPQFNRRTAGEGADPKDWQNFQHKYQKKNDNDESNDEEIEGGSGSEENESGEEAEEEQSSGKKKLITIPLHFKPIDIPRGSAGSRGGPRRGNAGRYRDRPYRDDRSYRDDQPRAKSPSQQQTPLVQQTGEYQNDEQQQPQEQQQQQQSRPYRGGSRQGSGRGEYRRSYGNSARGPRGSYNRSNVDSNTPDLDNKLDFPTLPPKQ